MSVLEIVLMVIFVTAGVKLNDVVRKHTDHGGVILTALAGITVIMGVSVVGFSHLITLLFS